LASSLSDETLLTKRHRSKHSAPTGNKSVSNILHTSTTLFKDQSKVSCRAGQSYFLTPHLLQLQKVLFHIPTLPLIMEIFKLQLCLDFGNSTVAYIYMLFDSFAYERQCVFCLMRQKYCWSYFAFG